MKRLKYAVLIPNGVGLRDFLCNRFVDWLLESGEVCIWHALPPISIAEFQNRWGDRVRWESLPGIRDRLAERLLRKAKTFGQLYWQLKQGPDVQLKRRRPPTGLRTRAVDVTAQIIGKLSAGPRGVVWLDRLHQKAALRAEHTREFEAFLRGYRPDILLCTDQRSLLAVPAMLAARTLRIPSVTFISSWDNLPKGRMPVYADHYFVWSEFMKNQLLGYYPDVRPEQVHPLGTPQFEPYEDEALIEPREKFLGSVGLDPGRPVVCFSGDDVLASPYDPLYLDDLAEELGRIGDGNRPQILFRRCPVDQSSRYDDVLAKHPEIAVSDPSWISAGGGAWWSDFVPTRHDTGLLVNVVRHSDLVVNLGSTMAMDFAVYDKPGIYVAYNPRGVSDWNVHDCYEMPHIKSVHELQPVYWARSRNELGGLVLHALENPREKSEERRAWLHRHVHQPIGKATERLCEGLRRIASVR